MPSESPVQHIPPIKQNSFSELDANNYATKKTVAQGLLDIALLTANVNQLHYVAQLGDKHDYYSAMVTLISLSIILQVSVGVLSMVQAALKFGSANQQDTVWVTRIAAAVHFAILLLYVNDTFKNAFMWYPEYEVVVGILYLVIGALNINDAKNQQLAQKLNHSILGLVSAITIINLFISGFGMAHGCRGGKEEGSLGTNATTLAPSSSYGGSGELETTSAITMNSGAPTTITYVSSEGSVDATPET